MGKWYEIKWIPSYYIPDEDVWPDFTHTYTARADGNVDVHGRARYGVHFLFVCLCLFVF